jgi:hypothetical protein
MDTQEIQVIERDGHSFIDMAKAHMVTDQQSADIANDILIKITAGLKEIEKKRLSFTAPLNQSLKEINATFKGITEPISDAKTELSQRLMSWRAAEQKRIQDEQDAARKEEERRRKIQEAHAAKGHQVSETTTPVAKPMPFSVQDTTRTRKQWTYDILDEKQIPREYLMVDKTEIMKAVSSGVRDIPGVKIYQKEIPIYA